MHRYLLQYRQDVLQVMGNGFEDLTATKLPVYLADESNLRNYAVSSDDWRNASSDLKLMVRGSSQLPMEMNHSSLNRVERTTIPSE